MVVNQASVAARREMWWQLQAMNAAIRQPVRNPVILTDAPFEDMTRKGAFAQVGRVELRGGVVTAMRPVHLNHSTACMGLLRALDRAIGPAMPLRLNPEISIKFGGGFQPTADIVVGLSDGANVPDGPLPAAMVKLVVEVADSALTDDLGQKLIDYA
jgi:hypothetical protein